MFSLAKTVLCRLASLVPLKDRFSSVAYVVHKNILLTLAPKYCQLAHLCA